MLHKQKVLIPATAAHYQEQVDKVTCDLCKEEIKEPRLYDVREVQVFSKEGHSFPEGGGHEALIFDICITCFTTRLVPWMKQQGAEPRKEEVDW